MSIESKAVFVNNIQSRFSSLMTADCMNKAMEIIADQLEHFSLEQTESQSCGTEEYLDAYLNSLRVEGKSPKTIERYKYLIGRMMKATNVPTRSITVYHLRQYLAQEKARGISDRTLEGTRQVFSAYFNWLHREQLLSQNPTANLGVIKYQKKIRATYSETDIEKMKSSCKTLRDRAIVEFLLSTGCRISEMVQLNRDSIDLNSLECVVLGKGNKERTVYLNAVTGMLLQNYLDQRNDNSPALFAGKGTSRISAPGVRQMMKRLATKSSVDHIHPHKFRRTLATSLIRHGMPIQEVASILGHDKLDTTMKYVVLDKTEVKNSYRKYS